MSRPSRIVAASSNWLAFAAALAVAFFLTPHLIRSLGHARYDVWCVVEAILAYFTLLDLGVGACLVRSAARCHSTGDTDGLNRVASCSLAIFSVAGACALFIGVPLALLLAPKLGTRFNDPADATAFMLVMLVNLAITLPLSVYPSMLDGLERFAAKAAVRIVTLAIKATGYVWVTWEGESLLPLAIVSLVVTILENLTMAILCRHFEPRLQFSKRFIDRETLRAVRGYSGNAFLTMLAGRITMQTGAVLIGVFLPTGQVTAFATAARLVDYAKTLLRTVTMTLMPGIAAMEAKGDWEGIRRLFLAGTRVVLYLVLPVNVGLILFGEPFLRRWVGSEVADGGYPAMVVLSLTLTLGVAQSMAGRVMYGLGQLKWYARLALIEAAVNVVLTLVLIGPFGVLGVSIAVMVPNVLFCVITIAIASRVVAATSREYLSNCWKPFAALTIPTAVWLAIGTVPAQWYQIFGAIGMGLAPYVAGVMALEWRAFRAPLRVAASLTSPIGIRIRSATRSARPAVVSHS